MIKHLQPVHTSTIARFGTAQLDKKCNVNCLRTVPDRTELARSIPPGWHGSARFVRMSDSACKSFLPQKWPLSIGLVKKFLN